MLPVERGETVLPSKSLANSFFPYSAPSLTQNKPYSGSHALVLACLLSHGLLRWQAPGHTLSLLRLWDNERFDNPISVILNKEGPTIESTICSPHTLL